MFIVSFM